MPIYAYKCESCGHAKDVLQKLSDAPLTVCPDCGAESFKKQVTAAGFQLKGSGWYATDFRGGTTASAAPEADGKTESKTDGKTDGKADAKAGGTKAAEAKPADSATGKSTAAPAPAAATGAAGTPSTGH